MGDELFALEEELVILEALRFAEAAGVISAAEGRRLAALPPGTELRRLRDLRTRLERMLGALQDQRSPSAEDLEELASEGRRRRG